MVDKSISASAVKSAVLGRLLVVEALSEAARHRQGAWLLNRDEEEEEGIAGFPTEVRQQALDYAAARIGRMRQKWERERGKLWGVVDAMLLPAVGEGPETA